MNFTNTTFIDQKYIRFLSGRLRNFRDKGNGVFEFSHSCERQNSNKRRGYFYPKGSGYNFVCHNCQESTKFFKFLEHTDTMLFKDYNLEVFKDSMVSEERPKPSSVKEEVEHTPILKIEGLIAYSDLPEGHPAIKFVERRQIPKEVWKDIFFCKDFFPWASVFIESFKHVNVKEPRLIIPYRNKRKEVIGFTCRSYGKSDRKYIEIKVDPNAEMIFGLDKVNPNKQIFAVEGPIDSMFIPNCVAVGGANYSSEFVREHKNNLIIIPDNDWKRNKDVLKKLIELANQGYQVALMPDTYKAKDINDAVVKDKVSPDEIVKMAVASARTGSELLLDIAFRRKC